METNKLNTVQTVLSQEAVKSIEYILHAFWNNCDSPTRINPLMVMLSVYVKYCSNTQIIYESDLMVLHVAELIHLQNALRDVVNVEHPWKWISTSSGWQLPTKEIE